MIYMYMYMYIHVYTFLHVHVHVHVDEPFNILQYILFSSLREHTVQCLLLILFLFDNSIFLLLFIV